MLGLNVSFVPLPLEGFRIFYAFIYLSIFTYFDLKNDRDIPDKVVYLLSLLTLPFLIFYPTSIQIYAIIQAVAIFLFVYVLYRFGQIGLAEAFSMSSLAILFPLPPVISNVNFELPFIFFIFVFSGIIFAVFTVIFIIYKIGLKKKFSLKEVLLLIIYIIFLYVYINSPFNNALFILIITILFISSIFSSMYKEEIMASFATKINVEDALDEVFAYDHATQKEKHTLGKIKVISKDAIKKMKENGLKQVTVYKMFPFSPFLLAGFAFSLFFSYKLILF